MRSFKKIFVSKQAGIGDVIVTTPVLKALKKRFPQSHLTLMVLPNAVELVSGLPFIDEVFVYDKERDSVWKLFKKLRGQDLALFLDLQYRPALVAALAGVPVRAGLEHKRKFWLNRALPWQEYMDHKYEPYVFGDILRETVGIDIPDTELSQLYVSEASEAEKQDLQGRLSASPYVVSCPVTAYFLKNWPLDRWNELYRRIYQEQGLKTVIFGHGPLEFDWDKEAVVSLWGQLNLRQVAELIKNAKLLVNGSSLPEHIAAATGTPCVLLYGFSDPDRWPPRQKCRLVRTALECSPCDGYHGSKCQQPRCMEQMTVEQVYAACREMLA